MQAALDMGAALFPVLLPVSPDGTSALHAAVIADC